MCLRCVEGPACFRGVTRVPLQGGSLAHSYMFSFWQYVDVFVYFSHARVTVPPPAWTHAGHIHGVRVLGTVIMEWDVRVQGLSGCGGDSHGVAIAVAGCSR